MRIAFTGKMRSGKDTIGEYATQQYGFERFAFGDPLKKYAKQLFPHEFENGNKPRELLQWFGQIMRERDPNIWIRLTFDNMIRFEDFAGVNARTMVTDLRQPNEFQALHDNGFVIIRVNATDDLRLARMKQAGDSFTKEDLTHDTEMYIDSFEADFEIINNGILSDTYKQLDDIIRYLE